MIDPQQQINNKTQQEILFERMVKAGFEPIKNIIQYEKLQDDLTASDIQAVADCLKENLVTWIKWLQHLDEQRNQGRRDQ